MLKNKASADTIQKASEKLRKNIRELYRGDKAPATREDIARLYVHSMLTLDVMLYASDLQNADATNEDKQRLMAILEKSLTDMAINLTEGLSALQQTRLDK